MANRRRNAPLLETRQKSNPREQKQDSERHASSAADDSARRHALGALIAFYRRLRDIGRQDLANSAGISLSLLGMIENGTKLPSQDALNRLGGHLNLTDYQRLQFHSIAGYSPRLPEAPGWEVLPEDVIEGIPLFLRNMSRESHFQDMLELEEVWMVAPRPLALQEPVLSWLKRKLIETDCSYTYFVDAQTGEADFGVLWDLLDLPSSPKWQDRRTSRERCGKIEQFRFILAPTALSVTHRSFAVFNPRSITKARFGRVAYFGAGNPIGVYAMESTLCERICSFLSEVVTGCEKSANHTFSRDQHLHGSFKLLVPPAIRG